MGDLEEAIRNIDAFCKTVVSKMVEKEDERLNHPIEPIENLFRSKYVVKERTEPNPSTQLIPLPEVDEPLIDIFEDDDCVRVIMQCHCRDQTFSVHSNDDGLEICKKECIRDAEGSEVCRDACSTLDLPVEHLQIADMISKCRNNEVLELDIPKVKTTIGYQS